MAGQFTIMGIYLGWIFCIKKVTNFWVYPILTILDWPQRIGFFAFTVSVPIILYFFGKIMNNIIWGSSVKQQQQQQKQAPKKKKQK